MQQDSASFWTDIKTLEEQLAKSPDSYCFARLSEVYLKVGLVDDALHTARQGVAWHPGYLAGQRALAMACHDKGLTDECLTALKRVTEALPEDHKSQKMLGRLSAESGDHAAARLAFKTVLEFDPDDKECLMELDALERSGGTSQAETVSGKDDDEIIELLECIEELEECDEDESVFEFEESGRIPEVQIPDQTTGIVSITESRHDPLATGTLAELYASQGFTLKALEIYRSVLSDDPNNKTVGARIAELELLECNAAEPVTPVDHQVGEAPEEEPLPESFAHIEHPREMSAEIPESAALPDILVHDEACSVVPFENVAARVPTEGIANNALSTLEGWLDNIRRIKSCR
ncbi:MAG: hypothetical protein WCP20_05500 [Desulfuromonadales bacterium]